MNSSNKHHGSYPTLPGYEILGELGRGGMGVVYKAREIGLDRIVALKMTRSGQQASASELTRFRREAEAVARLNHASIVHIHAIGEHHGNLYFSMEFVEGGNLAQRIKDRPQPPSEAAYIVEKLALAMQYAHEKRVIHRDLKPQNILVTEGPTEFKITDFGLAKKLDVVEGITVSGEIMGTPSYMSPEQAEGKVADIGPLSDVYSLGAILYHLLTGRPPFVGDTAVLTICMVLREEPVPPRRMNPAIPAELERICLRCLQKNPQDRFPDAASLAKALRAVRRPSSATSEETIGPTIHPKDRLEKPTDRSFTFRWFSLLIFKGGRVPLVVGLLLLLAVLGGWWLLFHLRDLEPSEKKGKEANPASEMPPAEWMVELANDDEKVAMKFLRIPLQGKTFWMGSPVAESDRQDDEEQHEVEFTADTPPFYLGETEVTQVQYRAVMGHNPAHFVSGGPGNDKIQGINTDRSPVEDVTHANAVAFCDQLTKQQGSKRYQFRLPTEAEWEYACRGGDNQKNSAPFYLRGRPTFSLSGGQINFHGLVPYNSDKVAPLLEHPARSGSFEADRNAFGLLDMHGNVREWCADWYGEYPKEKVVDPVGPKTGERRIYRGGSWFDEGHFCRAACRRHFPINARYNDLGFRVALVILDRR